MSCSVRDHHALQKRLELAQEELDRLEQENVRLRRELRESQATVDTLRIELDVAEKTLPPPPQTQLGPGLTKR